MPQNPQFTLNSTTLGVVYKTIGVLDESEGKSTKSHVILGAYYEPDGEYKGLYFVLPEGELMYFDIEVAKLASGNNGAYLAFEAEDKKWLIRSLREDDGMWISSCKVELPRTAMEQLIIGRSQPALNKFLDANISQTIPEFESLYAYYSEKSKYVVAINYVSSYGSYSRSNFQWEPTDLDYDYYADLNTVVIEPDKSQKVVEMFDDADGIFEVKTLLKNTMAEEA
jgi:hypothetical protein